jgi:cytosine/adenosine deaminase-related metal-dependent hydrolase
MDSAGTIIPDGIVLIENRQVVQVSEVGSSLPPSFAKVPQIDTGGTLFPGLIELHNHPSYNMIPLWQVPQAFSNRGQWRSNAEYKRRVANPASLLTHNALDIYPKAVVRFVECRALLGGVTTTQGLTLTSIGENKLYYEGLVRNVEFPGQVGWPVANDYINDFTSFDDANQHYGSVLGDLQRPYIIHLAEGIDQESRNYFQSFKRGDGSWLIGKNLIAIHATGLDAPEFKALAGSGGIVWSPLSNLLLYGVTTKVEIAKREGVPVALGSDWAPSGTKNLLGELKIAKLVSEYNGGLFRDQDLVRMVTSIPAKMLNWSHYVGSIEQGKIADLVVIDGTRGDPYERLLEATEADIVAVLIDGRPRAGRVTILDPRTPGVELLRVAKQDMVFDLIESPGHPLAKVRLGEAIASLEYGLAHLPDLATHFLEHHRLMRDAGDSLMLRLEMDEEFAMDLVNARTAIGSDDVEAMRLDPLTAVDDNNFLPRLKENCNLPTWLKEAL